MIKLQPCCVAVRSSAQPLGAHNNAITFVRQVACSASNQKPPDTPSNDQQIGPQGLAKCFGSIAGVMSICAALACTAAQPVQAAYQWKPRRHHKRLRETRTSGFYQQIADVEAREIARQEQKLSLQNGQDALGNVQQGIAQLGKQWKQTVQGEGQTISLDRSTAIRSAQRGPVRSVDVPRARPSWAPRGYRSAQPATVLGILLVIAAVGSAVFSLFGRQMGLRFRWGRAPEKGRWVRDRGLGGKLVFITEEPTSNAPGPLMSWDVDTSSPRIAEGIADPELWEALGAPETGPAVAPAYVTPEWWRPPMAPFVPASATAKDEARVEARSLIKALEDSKLLEGKDYSIDRLTALKRICTGAGIAARPREDNVRDAMFRSAVESAVSAAMTGGAMSMGQLGGDTAPSFVSGLAAALDVPEKSAVTIVHAAIAARAKSSLTNALAAQLKGQTELVLQELLKMSNLLEAFPFPPNTPEAQLVGSALQQMASLEFRKAVFMSFGYMNRRQAGIVAEMLGFDPALVLPTLDAAAKANQAPM